MSFTPPTNHGTAAKPCAGDLPPTWADRIAEAHRLLRHCGMCELNCNVDRVQGGRGRCGLDNATFVYKTYQSANEEPELLPALRLFLGACNLRCSFCDEAPEAFRTGRGRRVVAKELAKELCQVVERGVKTISVLGGEPTLHTHTLLEIAAHAPRRLPLALNTNMYMTPAVLRLLDGVIDWYLADYKFGNDACAQRIGRVPRYNAVVQRNLLAAARQTNVIIRHVLLPGHMECCFRPVVDWCAAHLPGRRFQLYPGYVPCGTARHSRELGRLNTPAETQAAQEYLRATPLLTAPPNEPIEASPAAGTISTTGEMTFTLGIDGRVYSHDLAPELASVFAELNPGDFAATSPAVRHKEEKE